MREKVFNSSAIHIFSNIIISRILLFSVYFPRKLLLCFEAKILTKGYSFRYYVQGKQSNQNVEYFADDWGYHPLVEYSSNGPHSKTSAKIALGKEAVKALHSNNKVGNYCPEF